mmetsp:Transcript_71831/g.127785  ORF Transcript_71831/g.127785 Transcript_71831/m.127785 type:complete len:527 (-) Transcript_71831:23-1603(-)
MGGRLCQMQCHRLHGDGETDKVATSDTESLTYDRRGGPINAGADKVIYEGMWKSQTKVAVIVAKANGVRRLLHEIDIFKTLGTHPHVIQMLHAGYDNKGVPLAVLEAVEPIGYDMNRLVNQYSWTGQIVPSRLMCKLIGQLISALSHMHTRQLIHQDLKLANVLVDLQNNVKLIDMGIVTKIGERGKLKAVYLAPEVCMHQILTEKVDCWGIGLILHQTYQKRPVLLSLDNNQVNMKRGVPSKKLPMAPEVAETMDGLLNFSPKQRWSLQQVLDSAWFQKQQEFITHESKTLDFDVTPADSITTPRQYLHHYHGGISVTAYAAQITSFETHIVGKKLGELDLAKKFNATVLLIANAVGTRTGSYERMPGYDTVLKADDWVYFGIKSDKSTQDDDVTPTLSQICQMFYGRDFALTHEGHDVANEGRLVAFSLEFDCFTFPDYSGGAPMVLGPQAGDGQVALDLRRALGLNIAGIVTEDRGEVWYPGAKEVVRPGDLGLVVRAPRRDGMSEPTVHDVDMELFMNGPIM